MACVYILSSSLDPDTVRYVGRSNKDDGDKRLIRHLAETRHGGDSHKCRWIRKVESDGGEIVATVLESRLTWEESGVGEIWFIAHYRSLGCDLTNFTAGGGGCLGMTHTLGRKHSDATKAKISAASLGRKASDTTKAKLSAAKMGNTNNLGNKASDTAKANMSAGQKGRTTTAETRAKRSASMMGNHNGRRAA